ncbi:ligase-associated DNA damage response exonuclease [Tahibacter amnicola]|uniref:Ligase-associated DNA damage response exonuclease n=1 Tax=Tahibacter amnicola TaxID=2976241 RepID=A0ABY6BCW6_9GAMM|nr:ligase-associated DNA damage response exonuclease [Tahibacter amnicola]UXI67048.1 ligase-associated DNA damage response exonuclease [Tahibacter amnicola]
MTARATDLVIHTPAGLYCPAGDFHIDPWQPVPRAVITHGHGDHARPGMGQYLVASAGKGVLQWRLGDQDFRVADYAEALTLGATRVSFHPAGHVLGSSQVRIECNGEVWVISGDYKRQADPTCEPFEVVRCDTFITEATFALPVYRWPDTPAVAHDILQWRDACAAEGEAAILFCYALGKAQRILAELAALTDQPALVHGAIAAGVAVYQQAGIPMLATLPVSDATPAGGFGGQLVLAPPAAAGSAWMRRFRRAQTAFASGWMRLRGNRRRRNVDRGFIVSDHADWPSLLHTVEQTGARRIIATHGASDSLVRFLRESGHTAETLRTDFGGED